MKKNISINISGIIFNIEEDGYDRLKIYLDEIKRYFATYDDTGEIAADIENRVAEIFLSKLNPQKQVITARDVESLIVQMGNVQDFESVEEPEETKEGSTYSRQSYEKFAPEPEGTETYTYSESSSTTANRSLYRDGKRKVIAGVASGIAHYFRVDPFWIRLLFLVVLLDLFVSFSFSLALLIGYIVLWVVVPERFDLSEDRKIRKMFRNPDNKVIGGVASGIAAYFGVDPTLIRILFILTIFLGGSGIIAYLVLWIITPEALTLTDRMQMQGEPVTLSNIEYNIKKNLNFKEGEENTVVKVLLFPFRLISAIFAGASRTLSPLIKFLGDFIRVVAGIVLIIVGFSFLFSLMTAGSFALGFFPEAYIDLFELDIPAAIAQNTIPPLLVAAGFIALFIPGLAVILVGIAIIAKRWLLNSAASWVLFALWIISILVSAFTIPAMVVDFKTKESFETETIFATDTSKTVVLTLMDESKFNLKKVVLSIKGHEDDNLRLEKRFWARGRNETAARELAQKTIYNVKQQGDTLLFSQSIDLPENTPFRDQELQATLHIPIGQKFIMDHKMRKIISYALYQYGFSSNDIKNNNMFVFIDDDNLVCTTCPEKSEDESESWTEDQSTSGSFTRKVEATDFDKISVGSHYRVFLTQSPNYSIRIEGEEDAVNTLEFEQNGKTVHFRNSLSFFDADHGQVSIFISLPHLDRLDLSGAAKAELQNWSGSRLELDLSGASAINLNGEVEEVHAVLSGSSEVNLRGTGQQLHANLSGSSELKALNFKIQEAFLDLSGASYAGVHAAGKLKVDASGVSHVKYRGNPATTMDKSHSSRIEKQED